MNKIKNLAAAAAFSLLILGLPAIASAQWNGGGYGQNGGGYGGSYNLKSAISNLKRNAKEFEKAVDHDGGRYNRGGYGRYNNGNLENLADQFKDATDDLEDAYDGGRDMYRSDSQAQRVLNIASQIDNQMAYGGGGMQGYWNRIQRDLNVLANAYGSNGRYNNQNRNRRNRNRNGNWRNSLPFPLPF